MSLTCSSLHRSSQDAEEQVEYDSQSHQSVDSTIAAGSRGQVLAVTAGVEPGVHHVNLPAQIVMGVALKEKTAGERVIRWLQVNNTIPNRTTTDFR